MWWWCGRGNQGSLIRLIGRLWHCYLAEMLPFCLCLRLGLIREFFVLTLFKIGMIGKYCWIVKSLFMFDDFMLAFVRERSLKPCACFSWFQGIDKETHSQTFFSHSYTVNSTQNHLGFAQGRDGIRTSTESPEFLGEGLLAFWVTLSRCISQCGYNEK